MRFATDNTLQRLRAPGAVLSIATALAWSGVVWWSDLEVLTLTVALLVPASLTFAVSGLATVRDPIVLNGNRAAAIVLGNVIVLAPVIACASWPFAYAGALLVGYTAAIRLGRELLKPETQGGNPISLCVEAAGSMVRGLAIMCTERLRQTGFVRRIIGRHRPRSRPSLEEVDRVVLMSHSYIGDAIMQTPAIELVARALPDAEVVVLTNGATDAVFRDNPFVSRCVRCLPTHGEYPTLSQLRQLRRLRGTGRTLCLLDFNGSQTMGKWLAWVLSARYVIGDGDVMPDLNFLLDEAVGTSDLSHHVSRNVAVVRRSLLGSRLKSDEVPALTPLLAPEAPERGQAIATLAQLGVAEGAPVAGLVVGSAGGFAKNKRWPLERFAALAQELMKAVPGVSLLAFKGPQELYLDYGELQRVGCHIVEGRSLLHVAAIIGRCDVMVGNDSGLSHVAASMGTPVVTVFGPTDWRQVQPYSAASRVLRQEGCPPCFGGAELVQCRGERPCILGVSVRQVADAATQELRPDPLRMTNAVPM